MSEADYMAARTDITSQIATLEPSTASLDLTATKSEIQDLIDRLV
jgi:hypothetical protein